MEHAIDRHTLLLVDLQVGVQVDSQDEKIRQDIACAHQHQDLRVLKGNLLGQLHHHQDDGEVGTVRPWSVSAKIDVRFESNNCRSSIHLRRHHFAGHLDTFRYGEIVEYGGDNANKIESRGPPGISGRSGSRKNSYPDAIYPLSLSDGLRHFIL